MGLGANMVGTGLKLHLSLELSNSTLNKYMMFWFPENGTGDQFSNSKGLGISFLSA